MSKTAIAITLLSAAMLSTSIVFAGSCVRYDFVVDADGTDTIHRIDRLTGETEVCYRAMGANKPDWCTL